MIEEGISKEHSDLATCIKHLKDFLKRQVQRLISCRTGTEFFLWQSDVQERRSYCQDDSSFFGRKQLEMNVLIDETDYEESPHPKVRYVTSMHMHTVLNHTWGIIHSMESQTRTLCAHVARC